MKSLLVICLMLSFGFQSPAEENQTQKEGKIQQNEITVSVKGMVCAFCAQGIEKKFLSQKEVEKVQVSLENKFVKLKFKEGQSLSKQTISNLLKDAGYESNFSQ